jgi:hypothetical protein
MLCVNKINDYSFTLVVQMNIILDTSTFSLSDIFLTDKKQNILIHGYFTKMIYSNQYISLSCIYYNLPLNSYHIVTSANDTYVHYDPFDLQNNQVIQELSEIEYRILEHYKNYYCLTANISNSIKKRLQCGKIKLFCSDDTKITPTTKIIIKISGIWETTHEIGLAIKFFPANKR